MMSVAIEARNFIERTLKISNHSIRSLSSILEIPPKRLLNINLLREKDIDMIIKLKRAIEKS